MGRALLFAVTGVTWFAFWFTYFVINGPSQSVASMQVWVNVIAFSATLLTLAVSLVTFGRMVGGPWVTRMATFAGATAALLSVTNIVEDGFRVEAAFYVFVLGMGILHVALAGLALAIVRSAAGRRRLLAGVPAATMAAILLFPVAGGPLMLGAWLAASAAAAKRGVLAAD